MSRQWMKGNSTVPGMMSSPLGKLWPRYPMQLRLSVRIEAEDYVEGVRLLEGADRSWEVVLCTIARSTTPDLSLWPLVHALPVIDAHVALDHARQHAIAPRFLIARVRLALELLQLPPKAAHDHAKHEFSQAPCAHAKQSTPRVRVEAFRVVLGDPQDEAPRFSKSFLLSRSRQASVLHSLPPVLASLLEGADMGIHQEGR
ncbi:uncharacterized protein EI90DRAFT_3047022 [Cantharellus anzutake]|uniref:uncharacterized protein n=1 Tax=Cantharellus anzutake TaxID=1750568 RepID=UPI0019076CC5|nr:uncharacterized protein EI90DRAFT_3047022 [Cantharellus anzutake]KAF8335751.1 hypothetical protein EI90DRAFT_3047022 [Cantharellus anzutake]